MVFYDVSLRWKGSGLRMVISGRIRDLKVGIGSPSLDEHFGFCAMLLGSIFIKLGALRDLYESIITMVL